MLSLKTLFFGKTTSAHVQLFRYLIVGGLSAVVDLASYRALTQFAGLHYLIAAFFSYMLGLTTNYILSLLWVFESRHGRAKEMTMVFLIALGGLFWTEVILYLLVDFAGMHDFLAKMVSIGIVLLWNYGMRKLYVFH